MLTLLNAISCMIKHLYLLTHGDALVPSSYYSSHERSYNCKESYSLRTRIDLDGCDDDPPRPLRYDRYEKNKSQSQARQGAIKKSSSQVVHPASSKSCSLPHAPYLLLMLFTSCSLPPAPYLLLLTSCFCSLPPAPAPKS